MEDIYSRLMQDVRFGEGLNACMNCSICTDICPAAEYYNTTCTGIGYHGDVVPFETIQAVVACYFALATETGFRQYPVQANRGYSLFASRKKSESMESYRPDMIIANCPGCTMFMDRWQYTINEIDGITYGVDGQGIPVLTYEEVAGPVLGYDPWELGLQYHNVQSFHLLEKMGIRYDPARRFLAKDGTRLPETVNLISG